MLTRSLMLAVLPFVLATSHGPVIDTGSNAKPSTATVCAGGALFEADPAYTAPAPTPAAIDLAQCLSFGSNHGACVQCCKELLGCGGLGPYKCNVCARFCHADVPPPPEPAEP